MAPAHPGGYGGPEEHARRLVRLDALARQGKPPDAIAARLGVSRSTVYRDAARLRAQSDDGARQRARAPARGVTPSLTRPPRR